MEYELSTSERITRAFVRDTARCYICKLLQGGEMLEGENSLRLIFRKKIIIFIIFIQPYVYPPPTPLHSTSASSQFE